jgi:hypothetical protein
MKRARQSRTFFGEVGGARMSAGLILAIVVALAVVALSQPWGGGGHSTPQAAAASLTVNLDQCANETTPCDWQNGDLNGNNSAYSEGRVVPFRLAIEGLAAGTHSIHINYDFTAGGHKAYDFLASFDATETVDPCATGGGGVSSLCALPLGVPSTTRSSRTLRRTR